MGIILTIVHRLFQVVLLLILVNNSYIGNSQNYFSKRYFLDNSSAYDFSTNIIAEPFGYTLQLEGSTWATYDQRRIGFLRIDTVGNILPFSKIYQYDSLSLGTGYGGSFLKQFQGNGFALAGYLSKWVGTGRYDQGVLMRLNNNLDTIWTKYYTDIPPHDSSIMFFNCRELNDYGYAMIGIRYDLTGNGFNRANLFRVDSAGQLKWQMTYGPEGTSTEYYPNDVSITSDNGFVIGANYLPYNSNTQGCDPMIIKTDSLGNLQWKKHVGNPNCRDGGIFSDNALDGNIQVGTIYSDDCWGNDGYESRINLIKLRNNQEIVWDKKYGYSKLWNSLNKIKVLQNGDIIATGHYYKYKLNESLILIGWILKTDSAGNEEWYRDYELVTGDNSFNILWNIVSASDKGFTVCGMVYPTPPDTGFENSWVLKVDSVGCEGVNNCWVGTDEIRIKTYTPQKPYVVYPNPATDKLTVEFHENMKGSEIELFDEMGTLVRSVNISGDEDLIDIDIGKLIPGVYLVRVIRSGLNAGADKIIKR